MIRKMSPEGAAAIGQNIRRLRESLGLSNAEFAEMLDQHRATISRWEAGVNVPTLHWVLRIAKTCNVEPSAIFGPGKKWRKWAA